MHEKNFRKKKIKRSVQQNFTRYFQLVPKLKTNMSLKLILVDMKTDIVNGRDSTKQAKQAQLLNFLAQVIY